MSSYPPPGPGVGSVGQRIEEAIELIEMEVRHAAAYINAAVIPQVRAESISALRNVANSLRNFADRLDRQQPQAQTPPPPSKEPRP
jgi:predicted transcriptional regulator